MVSRSVRRAWWVLVGATLVALSLTGRAHALCTQSSPCVTAPLNLGVLSGDIESEAYGVSADGSVVVGQSRSSSGLNNRAFRWTASGGMQSIGSLGGTSTALDVSDDGLVIVGFSALVSGPGNPAHAFRWTSSSGMQDLGTLGGLESFAYGVSGDGSVVVGVSEIATVPHARAFRWTSASGMQDLGTLGGEDSVALDVSQDGKVVVGTAEIPVEGTRAFRWTQAGGMENLGNLNGGSGGSGNSSAHAVNADGSVVVGSSTGSAFRWTVAGGMKDIGTLGGNSSARGVSGDGSVVVGFSDIPGGEEHVFRWTTATGMKDLNTLLANAGVDMSGITLGKDPGSGVAISANGQFIVGKGEFSGARRAFIVRYFDQEVAPATGTGASTTTVIAGVTTPDAVQSSINDLANTRFGLMAQAHGCAVPLLGDETPIEDGNEATLGMGCSSQVGGSSRIALNDKFSLLLGVGYGQEDFGRAEIDDSIIAAVALRYVATNPNLWHPFAEGGGWFAPDTNFQFERVYLNGAGTAVGVGSTEGDLTYLFGRAGLLFELGPRHQLVMSGEIGRERLEVGAYGEPLSLKNPFEAQVASGTDTMDLAKARLQWSFGLSPRFDATLWAAGVYGFNRNSELVAAVAGLGILMPTDEEKAVWAEYGSRVGYKVSETVTFDVLAGALSGVGFDTQVRGGGQVRVRF